MGRRDFLGCDVVAAQKRESPSPLTSTRSISKTSVTRPKENYTRSEDLLVPISGIGRLNGVADEVLRRSHLKEDKCSGKFNEKVNSYRDVDDAVRSPCRCFVAYDIGVW